jgi:hypothetical protein
MIGIEFSRHYAIVCDNLGCSLYRQKQGSMERQYRLGPITTFMPSPLLNTSPSITKNKVKGRKKITHRKGLDYARKTV